LEKWRLQKEVGWREQADKITQWLKIATEIKFDNEIMLRTKRRMAAGKFPRTKERNAGKPQNKSQKVAETANEKPWLQDQDCSIIDCLVVFFGKMAQDEWKPLLFCTNNIKDFGRMSDGKGTLNRRFQEGLPAARVFTELKTLAEFVKDKKTVDPPSLEEVEQEKKSEVEEELKFEQELNAWVESQRVNLPSVKTAHVRPGDGTVLTQDQQYKRWTDPSGVSWRLVFYNHAPMMGDPSLSLAIVLDRGSAQYSSGDVSEKCDQYLRTLAFKPG
jgi:hypothetical protein